MPIRRALVTGASSGIGECFARQLADRGTELILVARRRDRLERLAESLPTNAEVLVADLAGEAGLADVEARLESRESPIDLLVNNAGVGAYGSVIDLDATAQNALLAVNAVAPVRLSRAVLPLLVERGGGGVINVGSLAGEVPTPGAAVYGASKALVNSYSQALFDELRASGVHVLLLAPGVTGTEFGRVAGVRGGVLPPMLRSDADDVVREALSAFSRRQAVCMPGWHNRLVKHGSRLAPKAFVRRVSGLLHERMAGS